MRTQIIRAARTHAVMPSGVRRSSKRHRSPFPKIALCDPFPDEREMYRWGLSAAGFRVVSIDDEDVASAALRIAALKPDAVVTRLCPNLFGIDLTHRLRKYRNFAGVPIVLLTAHGEDATRILACAAGATAIYVLPLVPTELATTLSALTDQPQA